MQIANRVRAYLDRSWHRGGGVAQDGIEKISIHALGRPHARMVNPNTGIAETLIQDLYDIYFIAVAQVAGKLILFTQGQGSNYANFGVAAFNKTADHTNLQQQGQLASSNTFIVRALSIDVHPMQGGTHPQGPHPEDMQNFLMTYQEFDVNGKPWWQGLASWAPAAGGINYSAMGAPGVLVAQASTSGTPYAKNAYAIPNPIFLNPQENFQWQIDPTQSAGGAWSTLAAAGNPAGVVAQGLSVWVRLLGQLTRVA